MEFLRTLKMKNQIDWDQVRINAAIAAMQGLCANPSWVDLMCSKTAQHAIYQADVLIDLLIYSSKEQESDSV